MKKLAAALMVLCCLAADRPDLTGHVLTADGQPIRGATVGIYTAGVKTGTSTFCPGCYADCGKSAPSGIDGGFRIESLDPDLLFRVLIVAEGYKPNFVVHVDPTTGPIEVKLQRLPTDLDPARVLRGRVLGPDGPVAGASVSPLWGDIDPLSVTNSEGEFCLTSRQPIKSVNLKAEARGLAPNVFQNVERGDTPVELRLNEGATVTGRLVMDGKPVEGAVMGLVQRDRSWKFTGEKTIATRGDGRFEFDNVGPRGTWYVYAHMASIRDRGATHYQAVEARDGETVDAGDLAIRPAYSISGRIVLSDGKPIPSNTRVQIDREDTWDSQIVIADKDGRFSVTGFPAEDITVGTRVNGYRFSTANRSLNLLNMNFLEGTVDQNIANLQVLLEPGEFHFPKPDRKAAQATEKLRHQRIEGAE